MAKTIRDDAKEQLWRSGVLVWKLDASQKELYKLFYDSEFKVQTWLLARRSGKSYALCVLAIEQCLRKPNSIVKFVSPTKTQVNKNVRPLFKQILVDCPVDLQPQFSGKDLIYYFPNGSEIQLAGSDNQHAEKLRGGDSHIAIVDEAGSCNELNNLVKSILLPTTLITKGKIILASTPSTDPDHEFIKFIEEAEARGSLIKKTVFENPRITAKEIEELTEELGGANSDEYKRELLCLVVRSPKSTVLPEFTPELEKEIIKEWPRPPHFDCYEAMDLGFKDLTVLAFAYFDFRANKVIIEDELVFDFKIAENDIPKLVKQIEEKEKNLWYNILTSEQRPVFKRVSDIDYIVTKEIRQLSGGKINFDAVKKDNNEAAINNLRTLLQDKKIIIHPRCGTIIRHLRNAKWMPGNKSILARSPDDSHYDGLEAVKYLVRHVDFRKNPYPSNWGRTSQDLYGNFIMDKPNKKSDAQLDVYKRIFNVKK